MPKSLGMYPLSVSHCYNNDPHTLTLCLTIFSNLTCLTQNYWLHLTQMSAPPSLPPSPDMVPPALGCVAPGAVFEASFRCQSVCQRSESRRRRKGQEGGDADI